MGPAYTSLESIKASVHKWAETKPEISRVYVFGSRLRGKTHEGQAVRCDSDIDIAVQLNIAEGEATLFWIDHHNQWEEELQADLCWRLDLDLYEGKRTPCLHRYLTEYSGVVFERPGQPERFF